MSQLILSRGITKRNFLSKFIKKVEFGPYFLISALIVLVGTITVMTLTFSAKYLTKGHVLNRLESNYQELLRVNEISDTEISKVRALGFIEESVSVRRMQRPNVITFVNGETSIAQK